MNTPTETPRTEAAKQDCDHWGHVKSGEMAKLEIELAAVTKERDDNQRGWTYQKEATQTFLSQIKRLQSELADAKQDLTAALMDYERVVRERDEANADRARLREALEAVKPDLLAMRSFIMLGGESNWVGSEAQKSLRMLDEALSTPPPPVVPIQREEEAFYAGFNAGCDAYSNPAATDDCDVAFAAFRAKHPLP
jgi:hypothetical protein